MAKHSWDENLAIILVGTGLSIGVVSIFHSHGGFPVDFKGWLALFVIVLIVYIITFAIIRLIMAVDKLKFRVYGLWAIFILIFLVLMAIGYYVRS